MNIYLLGIYEFKVTIIDEIKAIIFDVDGVLVDSESMSCYALNVVFDKEFSIDIGSDYSAVLGTSVQFAIQYYLDKFGLTTVDLNSLVHAKEKAYYELAKNRLQSFPKCDKFILKLINAGYKVSVASSGSFEKIKFSLKTTDLMKFFTSISSSQEVVNGKPEPDLFELAISRTGFQPYQCVIIEDSINGIMAAKAAKAKVIGLTSSFDKDDLDKCYPDLVVNSYDELIDVFFNN